MEARIEMKNIYIRFIYIVLLLINLGGCYRVTTVEMKRLEKSLKATYKELGIHETTIIHVPNFFGSCLKLITPPYVSKEEFIVVINNEKLSEELAWMTASKESCHVFVICDNKLMGDYLLPSYINVEGRVLFSGNSEIELKLRKTDRQGRPLIIEQLK